MNTIHETEGRGVDIASLYMCMNMYMHVYTCIYIYAHIHILMCVYIDVHVH